MRKKYVYECIYSCQPVSSATSEHKRFATLLCYEKYYLPSGCHTQHKLFSVLEIISQGEFIKKIYLYYCIQVKCQEKLGRNKKVLHWLRNIMAVSHLHW